MKTITQTWDNMGASRIISLFSVVELQGWPRHVSYMLQHLKTSNDVSPPLCPPKKDVVSKTTLDKVSPEELHSWRRGLSDPNVTELPLRMIVCHTRGPIQ